LDRQYGHVPLHYYFPTGPIGQVLTNLKGDPRLNRVALVGLGTGALASYANDKSQHWTFFEIDPAVVYLARDSRLFTYWKQCHGTLDVQLGDARQSLANSKETFGLIVIDAFGSDAIPIHLLTREALSVYLDRLASDGLLAFHISNRYLNLEPVLAALANDHGLKCLTWADRTLDIEEKRLGKMASHWVLLARHSDDFLRATVTGNWRSIPIPTESQPWTDDFTNLISALRWEELFGFGKKE
jgi:SAM-dependent methyltransferase